MVDLDDVMQSKLAFIKKCCDLTHKDIKIAKPKQQSPKKGKGKGGKDVDPRWQFRNTLINHFYELGWEDPNLSKKIKSSDYTAAGLCPIPGHIEHLNITKVETYDQLVYHPGKYNELEQPYQVYIPHPYLVRKMLYAFAHVSKDCRRDLMYGGQLNTYL